MARPSLVASLRLPLLVFLLACTALFAFNTLAEDDGGFTGGNTVVTTGPDVTVWSISSTNNYGTSGGYRAYSVSSDSCNIGTDELNWCDEPGGCAGLPGTSVADHPVIAQNLYRLKDGRFRQLGKSWVKHGFFSVNSNSGSACQGNIPDINGDPVLVSCQGAPHGGDTLNVGCTDFYSASLNGSQGGVGPRIDVQPTTGIIPSTDSQSGTGGTIGQRLQVLETDLVDDADGYWVEIHYVGADDAQYVAADESIATNGLNNASYRTALLGAAPSRSLSPTGSTQREAAAIWAWKAADSMVEIANTDVISGGSDILERFHVARRVTSNTARGLLPAWHYEIVVHNMNSERKASALEIQFPAATNIANAGFYDVDWHSGEETVQSNLDWSMTAAGTTDTIRWATLPDGALEQNAIPWSTSFNFWFDSDLPPDNSIWTLELFEPGTPTEIVIPFNAAPKGIFSDGFESGDTGAWAP